MWRTFLFFRVCTTHIKNVWKSIENNSRNYQQSVDYIP